MNLAVFVEDGVLIGVVGCSGAHQLGDQRRLAGEAGPGQQQSMASPADHSGMDEDAVRRIVGGVDHELARQLCKGRLLVGRLERETVADEDLPCIFACGSQQRELLEGRQRGYRTVV